MRSRAGHSGLNVREEITNLPRAVYNLIASVVRVVVGAIIVTATSRRELPRHPAQQHQENRSLSSLEDSIFMVMSDTGRDVEQNSSDSL